jgi:hypothetical protein
MEPSPSVSAAPASLADAPGAPLENITEESSSLGREIVSGLVGLGVTMCCVIPPVVHLITGPLGPLLGGFVAANRANPGARGRIIIAGIIGTGVAGLIFVGSKVFVAAVGRTELPDWFPSGGTLGAILAGVWVYGVVVASIGTLISTSMAQKKSAAKSA